MRVAAREAFASCIETDPRWQLTERLIASPGLAKSARLSSLLLHIVQQTIDGKERELNEQRIGERVFGRPVGYDPRDDNIVRAHASRLRQKLETYFQEDGKEEPLRMSLPRGSYVPSFERQDGPSSGDQPDLPPDGALPGHEEVPPSDLPRPAASVWPRWALAGVLGLICVASLSWSGRTLHSRRATDVLWSAIFGRSRDTLIVPADSSLIVLRSFTRHAVSIADYASGRYLSAVHCQQPCDPSLLSTLAEHRYTSLADLQFAVALSHLPEALPSRTVIRYARDLQMDDLKHDNLILIGSLEADPWLQFFQGQMNFVLHDDRSAGALRIENRRPAGSEQASYLYDPNDPAHRGYAVVAFLPNLSGTGNVLVVQGFTLAGTQAATEFVTSGRDFDALFASIIARRRGLPHFEVLLRTMDVNGLGARPSVVTYRVY